MNWHRHHWGLPFREADALTDSRLLAWHEWLTRPEIQASYAFWDAAGDRWFSFRTRRERGRFWELLARLTMHVVAAHVLRRIYVSDLFIIRLNSDAVTELIERSKRTK